jgi:hypothetical protein
MQIMNLNNRLAIKIYFPAVKITGAAVSSVPDTIPESCDSSFTEADQLAFPMLSNEDETFLDVEALDEILFDALSNL